MIASKNVSTTIYRAPILGTAATVASFTCNPSNDKILKFLIADYGVLLSHHRVGGKDFSSKNPPFESSFRRYIFRYEVKFWILVQFF